MTRTLLTVLGTGKYEPIRWVLGDDHQRGHTTRYAPAATAALCGPFDDAVLLLTPEARQAHGEPCRAELEALGMRVREATIPLGLSDEDLWRVFVAVRDAVDADATVVLDVTHALRHLPFVLFASAAYLTALSGVSIGGVYYGAFVARSQDHAPLVDLGALLTLASWAQGIRGFRETGNPAWLARLVRQEAARSARSGAQPVALSGLASGLERLALTLPAGLPLEAGVASRRLLGALAQAESDAASSPLLRTVYAPLRDSLASIACPEGVERKSDVELDREELRRQLRVARAYHAWGQPDRALLVLREWLVNGCLLASRPERPMHEEPDAWTERERREPVARGLGSVKARRLVGAATDPQRELMKLWERISTRRNRFAHAGFSKPDNRPGPDITADAAVVEKILEQCEALLQDESAWSTERPDAEGQLLVTALGTAPGVLYTALRHLRPAAALVVTSAEGGAGIAEACDRAGWPAGRVERYEVADAFACFEETDQVRRWARPHLLVAAEVLVNHTGGTTGMQYLVERLAAEALRLGVPVRHYALIDRRDGEAQRLEPYHEGELVALGADGRADDDE